MNTKTYNFYSNGEEVLDNPHSFWDPATWSLISPVGENAWTLQELTKGRGLSDMVLGSTYGGWGFNDYWSGKPLPKIWDNGVFIGYDGAALTQEPYFIKTNSAPIPAPALTLYGSTSSANAYLGDPETRSALLANMFPARTLAVGRNPLNPTRVGINQEMMSMQNGWPSERGDQDWRHSDLYNVSYPYVHTVFDGFVFLGDLNNN